MKTFPLLICILNVINISLGLSNAYEIIESSYTKQHLAHLKNQTRSLFYHGWDSYMKHGFPLDEVRPISCEPYTKDSDVLNFHRNDVLGNYSVTLLDTITTFAIMGDIDQFVKYIKIIEGLDLNVDSTVQVFETAIRALGSLLSAHLYATDQLQLADYDGFLLSKAHQLGVRLLPAYTTYDSGIPLPRVNLKNGASNLPKKLYEDTCTAGAASPFLELTLLSILTNDTRFEHYSRNTFFKLWNSRSKLDLLPMTIDPVRGVWLDAITGIGASIDSFYEYALKGSILFNDADLMEVWQKSYKALTIHSKNEWFFGNVHVDSGLLVSPWIDALSAFFPGLLVLAGNIEDAIKSHIPFVKLWNQYQGIPERWDFLPSNPTNKIFGSGEKDPISLEWYLLRPEFIESTYYLYRATKDPFYLRVGEQILNDYIENFKVECGFAGYRDVRTKKLQNRMESFVLSETFMYLYLLFDEENGINYDKQAIFSTEGHPLWLPKGKLTQYNQYKLLSLDDKLLNIVMGDDEHDIGMDFKANFNGLESINDSSKGLIHDLYISIKEWSQTKLESLTNYTNASQFIKDALNHSIGSLDKAEYTQQCETSNSNPDLFADYLNDPQAFLIDSKFHDQWKFKDSTIELSNAFYQRYANPKAICFREPTTIPLEFLIGDRNEISKVLVEQRSELQDDGAIMENIYLSSISGLRLKIELLPPHSVDHFNHNINSEFVNSHLSDLNFDYHGTCKVEDEVLATSVLRIKVINGVDVGENSTIYINSSDLQTSSQSLSVTKNGNIKMDNTVVVNMRVFNS